jgi:hypothetical protein
VRSIPFEFQVRPAGRTFNGRDHRVMPELDDLETHEEAWSAASMSFPELKTLLANLSPGRGLG